MQKNEVIAHVDVGILNRQTSPSILLPSTLLRVFERAMSTAEWQACPRGPTYVDHPLSSPHILQPLRQWQSPAGDPERAENLPWQDHQDFGDGCSKHRRGFLS